MSTKIKPIKHIKWSILANIVRNVPELLTLHFSVWHWAYQPGGVLQYGQQEAQLAGGAGEGGEGT